MFGVADGVGGARHGEIASACAMRALEDLPGGLLPVERVGAVRHALAAAHAALLAQAEEVTATTVVVLMLAPWHFACLWAGDSRAYLLRDGVLTRLTSDHSVVQELVDEGRITLAEAETHPSANMITRAVGSGGDLLLDKSVGDVRPNDCFLLCSDGLYKAVSETRIAAILGEEGDVAQALVAAALENRARDNVTAVVAKVEVD